MCAAWLGKCVRNNIFRVTNSPYEREREREKERERERESMCMCVYASGVVCVG